MKRSLEGFTLIELLIVVAIIGILAAIAIPNFLQAQTRAKVAHGKSEMASVATALESYRVDNSQYPPAGDRIPGVDPRTAGYHSRLTNFLTTPVPYIKSLPFDPFVEHDSTWWNARYPISSGVGKRYVYYNTQFLVEDYGDLWGGLQLWVGPWLFYGYGPDKTPFHGSRATLLPYDPTNGTVSLGNVIRCQKKPDGIPLHPTTGTYLWP